MGLALPQFFISTLFWEGEVPREEARPRNSGEEAGDKISLISGTGRCDPPPGDVLFLSFFTFLWRRNNISGFLGVA
jgi:hypothetical protein